MGILDKIIQFVNGAEITSAALVIDGAGGKATVKAMQRFFGTTQDGIISGQNATLMKKYCPALVSYKAGSGGSPCIKNLQRWVGTTQDGILGQATVKAWQKKIGTTADGIFGTNSMKVWQKYLNEHSKAVYPEKTLYEKIMDACQVQAEWSKNSKYAWQQKPTIAKSKTKGTCVTYVACVLQRLGYLKSGECIWCNGRGYGTGKVLDTNSKMTVTYMGNKTITSLKSKLKGGDIVVLDDNKSGKMGSGGHFFILTGKWTSAGNPYIWDNASAQNKKYKCKAHTYSGKRKVLAVVRLKEVLPQTVTPTIVDKELEACKVQAEYMKNYTYKWQNNPTIEKSKKYGTCVTYVACVLQRIGYLKSGQYIWINTKGKVEGANSKMTVTYPSGTLKSNKSKLKAGDIVIGGNGKTGAGAGSHIFILTGKWDGDNPYIYDQDSASRVKKGKSATHTWKGSFKMIALIRLK